MLYFRAEDEFVKAPYEMIKRLFAATDSPDLHPAFSCEQVKIEEDLVFLIPLLVENRSSAIAEHVKVNLVVENPTDCELIMPSVQFRDASNVNPGQKIYIYTIKEVIHRGLNLSLGNIQVKMKRGKNYKRRLDLSITVYANKMIAKRVDFVLILAKKGVSVREISHETLY